MRSVFSSPAALQDERTRDHLWIDPKVPPPENYKLKDKKNAVVTKGIILGEGGDPKKQASLSKKKKSFLRLRGMKKTGLLESNLFLKDKNSNLPLQNECFGFA